jgi:hypothetical protein
MISELGSNPGSFWFFVYFRIAAPLREDSVRSRFQGCLMVYLLTQIPANLVIWYIFPPFWYVVPRKSGNPHLWSSIIVSKTYSIKHTFWQNTTTSNWRIWRREIWRI